MRGNGMGLWAQGLRSPQCREELTLAQGAPALLFSGPSSAGGSTVLSPGLTSAIYRTLIPCRDSASGMTRE